MPRYSITGPDGKTYSINGPEGASREEVISAIQQQQALQLQQEQEHLKKTGFIPAIKAAGRSALGAAEEALGFEEAAAEQRQKAAQTFEGMSEEDVARAKEKGLLPYIGALATKEITEPLGGIAGRFGVPIAAGLLAPETAILGLGARALATAATDYPLEYGENIEAQRQAGMDVDKGAAALTAVAQASIASFGVPGTGAINRTLGPKLLEEARVLSPRVRSGAITEQEAIAQLSGRAKTYAQSMLANTVAGTALMAGTEELRRAQAGQPGMTQEELGETAKTAALLSPIFGALHPTGRKEATKVLSEAAQAREKEYNDLLSQAARLGSLDQKAAAQRLLRDEIANQQVKDWIHSNPNKPVQELIDEVIGIKPEPTEKETAEAKKNVIAALNEPAFYFQDNGKPTDQYVIDPVTQQERRLTVGELQKIQRPDLFTGEEALITEPDIVTDKTLTDLGISASTPLVKKGGLRDLDLTKPEEAQQFIEGISEFGKQAKLDQKIKDAINLKVKEVQDKLKEAEDARLRTERDTSGISVSGRPGEPPTARELEESDRLRTDELATDIRSAQMGEAGRGAPLVPEAREVMKSAEQIEKDYKGPTLLASLKRLGGISLKDKLDVTGERARPAPGGYNAAFNSKTEKGLMNHIESGSLDEFLPYDMRLQGGMHEARGEAYDPAPAYNYLADRISNGEKILPFELEERVRQAKEVERGMAQEEQRAGRTEEEINKDLAEATAEEKDIMYAKGEMPLTRETPETIIKVLKDKFGKNIDKSIQRGDLKLIQSKDLPKNIAKDAVAYFDKGVAHLITDRLSKEEAPRKLLHEVGAHYGLEGMVGKALYRDILRTLNRLKTTDKEVKDAFDHVERRYKDLEVGSHAHLEEVLARVGESAPNHNIIRRVIAAIKDFLIRKGLWNPNTMDVRDIQDLITRSTERALAGKIRPEVKEEIKYAREEEKIAPISERYRETSVFASPAEEGDRSFKEHVGGILSRATDLNKNDFERAFISGRIKVANPAAGVQTELIKKYNGSVLDSMGDMRADIAHDQALNSNILGAVSAKQGKVVLDKVKGAKVVDSPDNIYAIFDQLKALSNRIGAVDAEHTAGAYLQALRYSEILKENTRIDAEILNTRNRLAKDKKEAYAKGTPKDINTYNKIKSAAEKSIEELKAKKKIVSDEQIAAIPAALRYAEEHPEIKQIANIYDKVRLDEIDLLEQGGIYGKEFADNLRKTKGYVPLFRLMDDLESMPGNEGARQYFRGLADVGKEYAFEGSDRRALNVFDNMLTRHMWAVNAATRNHANRMIADELAIRTEDNKLKTYNILPEGKADVMTPIWIDGKRTFVEYADPFFARAVYGVEPALPGILGWMGKASRLLRTGVTALPTFQAYQVFNDATRAAMISGVNHPFKLVGEVVSSFYKILRDPNDPIVQEMNKAGISGGYGHTAKEIADKMRRDLGLTANSLTKQAYDKAEKFAATSDMAQRRALYRRSLLETGGVEQADGSILGGNKVLAMDRAMNIIHWQKHGTSNIVRVTSQVVPFMNAYIQGMDVLVRAMRGEGISGRERKEAQFLFASTALKLAALATIYSMAVAGDEEYQKLDDRSKVRSLIIPGTGVKIPVSAEVAMFTKAIPELTWQYIVRGDTTNPMDATKLYTEIGRSFADGLMGPNLMPQAFRAGIEVATNHDFLTGNPIVGRGLENLETSRQFTENTSELAKFIGKTGVISPLNLDHLLKGYGGTMASGFLYGVDATANLFYDDKLPTTPLHRVPAIGMFFYNPNGKGQLNDYYDLKDRSDEVTATLNNLIKFGSREDVKEYREENKAMIAIRSRINTITNQMKLLREQRKRIINSDLSSDEKRAKIDDIDSRINRQVENIGMLRVKAGL